MITASQKEEERSIKLRIGGNRNRRPKLRKRRRRRVPMRLLEPRRNAKTMLISRLAPQISFPSTMKTLPLLSLPLGITTKHMVYPCQPTLLSIAVLAATFHLTSLNLSILRKSRPNLFQLLTDIHFQQLDAEILSSPYL